MKAVIGLGSTHDTFAVRHDDCLKLFYTSLHGNRSDATGGYPSMSEQAFDRLVSPSPVSNAQKLLRFRREARITSMDYLHQRRRRAPVGAAASVDRLSISK